MSCPSCASLNQAEFTTEMMIHFSGPMRVDNPGVLMFSKILVCMDCGFSRFTTTEAQLRLLSERIPASFSAAA
jgi:hypothetical protein